MLTRLVLLVVILQSLWGNPATSSPTVSDQLASKLGTRVPKYDLNAGNFVDALTRVGSEFQVPMGIEWVNASAARVKLNRSWKDVTVEEIIQTIVKTQPGYEILVRGGIVRVYSPKLIPERQNFLRLHIDRLHVNREVVEIASRRLRERVKLTVSPPKPQPGGGGVGSSLLTNPDDPQISLQLSNASVEEILDALAVASARKIWIVTFSESPSLTPTGFRRTLSLWNSTPMSDDEQPVWDMFHWGEALPSAVLKAK